MRNIKILTKKQFFFLLITILIVLVVLGLNVIKIDTQHTQTLFADSRPDTNLSTTDIKPSATFQAFEKNTREIQSTESALTIVKLATPQTPSELTPADNNQNSLKIEKRSKENKMCFLTGVSRGFEGVTANIYTNLLNTECNIKSFEQLSLASAAAQVSHSYQKKSFNAFKSGPYLAAATKNLTSSEEPVIFVGNERFAEIITLKMDWSDLIHHMEFVLLNGISKKVLYYPLKAKGNLRFLWSKGESIYSLVNPKGETFVLVYYDVDLISNLDYENLLPLNDLLVLPLGWKFTKSTAIKPIWYTTARDDKLGFIMSYDNLSNIYVKMDLTNLVKY